MHKSLRSSSLTHGKARPQDRNTPIVIVPALQESIGRDAFDLDPCSNARSVVPARYRVFKGRGMPRPIEPNALRVWRSTGELGLPPAILRGDGLLLPWENYYSIFLNPPWGTMGPWLEKAARTCSQLLGVARGLSEAIALVPIRTHRSYWPFAWLADAICFLKPIAYGGFVHQIPTPCAMIYWGHRVQRFIRAFDGIWGTVLTGFPVPTTLAPMSDSNPDLQRLLLERLVLEADPAHLTSVLLRAGATMTIGDVLVGLERAALSPEAKARLSDAIRHMPIGAKAEPATLESVKARMREGMQRVAVSARPAKKAKKSPPRAAKKAGKKAAKKAAKKATKKPGKKAGKKATARRGLSDAAQAKAAIDAGYARAADLKPTASKSNGNGKGDPSVLDARLETEVLSGRATPVRTSDVVNALEVSAATALRTLRRAVDRGVLVPQGQGRAAAYVRTESRLGLAEAMA